jgi:hypothetical protein
MSFEDDHSETHRKVMARLAQMTAQERTRLLQEAGVLDDNGQLAERYLPPEDILVQQQRLRAAGDDLRLHFSITGQPAAWFVTRGSGVQLGWGDTPQAATDHALAQLQTPRSAAGRGA